jgi:two-component system sensor histidine kinase DctS
MIDVCLPIQREGRATGFITATLPLVGLLQAAARNDDLYEFSFVEADGTRLARFGSLRGIGRHVVRRVLDLPGSGLELKVDSTQGSPGLLPNVTLSLVLALSIALSVVVALLLRDMRRRSHAEAALADSLAFRKAMENSLITGLRARDLQGRITYVNPAFCAMVGQPAQALLATGGEGDPDPPYWPPERVAEYRQRQSHRHLTAREPDAEPRLPPTLQGFETVFLRANGERFPVLIYEAPLVDVSGHQSGWMSAVVDISEQQRSEEQVRVQQERLQATARLATMGEMASLLSHELNQPLAAIASYASGSMNLLRDPDSETLGMVREAVGRMAEQAERAGRVIKSVHDFVRRREQARESMPVMQLFDAVLPLVRLQARKSGARVLVQVSDPALRVLVDRTMLEQVLLNLTRNGIQAMERDTPVADRELWLRATDVGQGRVMVEVEDRGPGISPQVQAQLFTPFFTTREDGMGLGLSLCRTVVEQHGGTLEYGPPSAGRGCVFRFTVPQPQARYSAP